MVGFNVHVCHKDQRRNAPESILAVIPNTHLGVHMIKYDVMADWMTSPILKHTLINYFRIMSSRYVWSGCLAV